MSTCTNFGPTGRASYTNTANPLFVGALPRQRDENGASFQGLENRNITFSKGWKTL